MNIGLMILIIIGGVVGVLSTGYMVISLVWVIMYKIYRKIRYNASLYD